MNEAWKAAVEEAWNAYRAGSIPIGAAITDRRSNILARGRSRQYESAGDPGTVFGNPLSHAELNALLSLDYARFDPRECVLYTTVEPCPLCVGAAYMAGIRRILYASPDPRAGSADMLGATPYLSVKRVKCLLMDDVELEEAMIALIVEFSLRCSVRRIGELISDLETVSSHAVAHGRSLFESGSLHRAANVGVSAEEAFGLLVPRRVLKPIIR